MGRYCVHDLGDDIDRYNEWLESAGSSNRLVCGGRNGYQAVDEYSVDADCNRIGSGVNRNVCCGSSRECNYEAKLYYYQELARINRGDNDT